MVRAIKVTLQQILDSDAVNAVGMEFIEPKKATILSNNSGTLVEDEVGQLFLVPVGEWFRSSHYGKRMSQVTEFNKLQDLGFTLIKDKLVRNEEKLVNDGQEIRSEDNVSVKKVNKAVASNTGSKKENQNRP
jgi:hypothetical protein